MRVGFSFAGTLSRPDGSMPQAPRPVEPEEKSDDGDDAAGSPDGPSHYFRVLSPICHGSLASAYQAIRAQAAAAGAAPAAQADDDGRGDRPEKVILSGQGVPGAMRAYEDVIS